VVCQLKLKKAIIFDLGNTLVRYYDATEFPTILGQCISEVGEYLRSIGVPFASQLDLSARVEQENHESNDFKVRPLEERMARIFQLDQESTNDELVSSMCRRFMKPIFARGRIYDEVLASLRELRLSGYRVGLVSNTSWGSPAFLWREELDRRGLSGYLDKAVFCRDVGWRKPDSRIFAFALGELGVDAKESVFVGDEPRWDVVGPKSVGMHPILIDREGRFGEEYPDAIHNLLDLAERLRD